MKKMLRILTAAMLITASLPMSTVFAEGDTNNALWYWGTATQDTFSSMERIDSWSGLDMTFCTPAEQHETYLSDHSIYMVSSQDRLLQFKLRDDVYTAQAVPEMMTVIEKYYPGLTANLQSDNQDTVFACVPTGRTDSLYQDYTFDGGGENKVFRLQDYRTPLPSQEVGDHIRRELAAKGLISEFYNWGQTGMYQRLEQTSSELLAYPEKIAGIKMTEDAPVEFHEEAVDRSELVALFDHHTFSDFKVGLEGIRSKYAAYPVLDPFGMLLLEDGDMQYYKLTGTIGNTELQFYKIVKEDHIQYYADTKAMHYYSEIDDKSAVGNYLMGMPGNSELYELGDVTLYPRMFRHSDDIRYEHKESAVISIDPEPVRTYLAEKHPGYTFELTGDQSKKYYQVIPNEELSFHEKMDLFAELYREVGLYHTFGTLENKPGAIFAQNAMEQQGDTNLDCEVDILDVIAANKHILGVGTLDKTGLKNADMDGNGTADAEDSLAILKAVLGIPN